MKAPNIMVRTIVVTHPQATVSEVAKLLIDNNISAVPVVDNDGRVIGVVSEADLMRRTEIGTEKLRPWWLEAVTPGAVLAKEFAQSHGKMVAEVMSSDVISASEDTPVSEIASLLERHRIKRVPIPKDGKIVGIVSRSNLMQALASAGDGGAKSGDSDHMIRADIVAKLAEQSWTDFGDRNVVVVGGVVHLWGLVGSLDERKALTALAEGVPGVRGIRDEMIAAY